MYITPYPRVFRRIINVLRVNRTVDLAHLQCNCLNYPLSNQFITHTPKLIMLTLRWFQHIGVKLLDLIDPLIIRISLCNSQTSINVPNDYSKNMQLNPRNHYERRHKKIIYLLRRSVHKYIIHLLRRIRFYLYYIAAYGIIRTMWIKVIDDHPLLRIKALMYTSVILSLQSPNTPVCVSYYK